MKQNACRFVFVQWSDISLGILHIAYRSSIFLAWLRNIYCDYMGPSPHTPKPKGTLCKHSCQCALLTILSLNAFNWAITVFCVPLCSASNFLSEESLYSTYMLTMLTIQWDVCACAWLLLAYVEGWEYLCQVWWLTSLVPILRRLSRQDCYRFKARLGYIVSSKSTRVKDPVFKERKRKKKEIETHQSCLQPHSCPILKLWEL